METQNLTKIAQDIINSVTTKHGATLLTELYKVLNTYYINGANDTSLRKIKYASHLKSPLVYCHKQQVALVHRHNKLRTTGRTHRNGLIVGTLNGTNLNQPTTAPTTLSNPYPALIVYTLLKQGAITLANVDHPYNRQTLNALHQASPALHKLLTSDHYAATLTLAHLTADPASTAPLDPTNPTSRPHPTHTSLPATHVTPLPDHLAQRLIDHTLTHNPPTDAQPATPALDTPSSSPSTSLSTLTNLIQQLDTFLRWLATLPQVDRLPERLHFTLNPLHTSTPTAAMTTYNTPPRVLVNRLDHQYPLATVSLLRPLLAASIGRPDLYQGWRGDSDKRYYAVDKRGYCTRGSYNKVFGYALRRLETAFVDNPRHTLNPYELLHMATTILDEEKPYLRPATYDRPHPTPLERLLATPKFDIANHEWRSSGADQEGETESYDEWLTKMEQGEQSS